MAASHARAHTLALPVRWASWGNVINIRLVINPATDAAFAAAAEGHLARGADTPPALEAALRSSYPLVVVHSGIRDEGGQRLYAYRDGRWVNEAVPAGATGESSP